MTDNELLALTLLLDDEDPELQAEIRRQMLEKGQAFVPRLEWVWEQQADKPQIQEKIVDMIQWMQSDIVRSNLKKWRLSGGKDLLEGWFLLSQFRFPSIEIHTFRFFITRLVNLIWLDMDENPHYSERILSINRILFAKEGFRADKEEPFHPNRFFIKSFWDTKIGNPFSLGILYLIIAQKLDLPITGILLPDYFALHYEDHKYNFYIDAYNNGGAFYKNDLDEFIRECAFPPNPDYYLQVSNRMILVGLIESLIRSHDKRVENEKATALRKLLEVLV